jgi:hypothetical protein
MCASRILNRSSWKSANAIIVHNIFICLHKLRLKIGSRDMPHNQIFKVLDYFVIRAES